MLVIDLDPQGNASTGLGIARRPSRGFTSYDLLFSDDARGAQTCETVVPNLTLIPATPDLSSADVDMVVRRPAAPEDAAGARAPTTRRSAARTTS